MRRIPQSILRRNGIRYLPGVYLYPAKSTVFTVNQGGTTDNDLFVLDRGFFFLSRAFLLLAVQA